MSDRPARPRPAGRASGPLGAARSLAASQTPAVLITAVILDRERELDEPLGDRARGDLLPRRHWPALRRLEHRGGSLSHLGRREVDLEAVSHLVVLVLVRGLARKGRPGRRVRQLRSVARRSADVLPPPITAQFVALTVAVRIGGLIVLA